MPSNKPFQQSTVQVPKIMAQAAAFERAGQWQDAERLYLSVVREQPRHALANHRLGSIALQARSLAAALPYFKAALEADPAQWRHWLSYTDALVETGQAETALTVMEIGRQRGLDTVEARAQRQKIEMVVRRENARMLAHIEQLFTLFNAGRHAEAESGAQAILERRPNAGLAWKLLGVALIAQRKEAISPLRKAASLLPADAEVHFNLGMVQRECNQYHEAAASYRQALAQKPDFAEAANDLGIVLKELGQIDEAAASFRRALDIKPDFAQAHSNLGMALRNLGQFDEAIVCLHRALAIMPDLADAHNNLGMVLKDLGRFDEAVASYRRAAELKPDYAKAYNNLGAVLQSDGRIDDAIASYRRALEIKPNYAEARFGLAAIMLYLGNFAQGWQLYEARCDPSWKHTGVQAPSVGFPQWQGQSLCGKALLVLHEQGLGDQIQFCRYMPMLKEMGASRITLVCDAPLKPLFDRLACVDLVLVASADLTAVTADYWCFLLSLPLHCHTTTIDDIPATIPYLRAEPTLIERWAARFAEYPEFKVGICWRGSKGYSRDSARSPGLQPFKKLFGLADTRFVSLQPGCRDEFLAAAGAAALDIGREIDARDFEETAALIQNLDLVVTCDTAVGHLAGALGKTVWVVVPFYADWRWLAERDDSPWYPHTRVFRQTRSGGWEELFERVAQRLQSTAGASARAG